MKSSDFPSIRIAGLNGQLSCTTSELPILDRKASNHADQIAIQHFGIHGSVLMENAARHVAQVAFGFVVQQSDPYVVVFCGSGNNGGDGYAAARHLHEEGVRVDVFQTSLPRSGSDAARNHHTCQAMGIPVRPITEYDSATSCDLIIDALFGTGLDREVTGNVRTIIDAINNSKCPVISVDIPSGMECDTGQILGACVKASSTVTFVALKPALMAPQVRDLVGEIIIADIGVSRSLIGIINSQG